MLLAFLAVFAAPAPPALPAPPAAAQAAPADPATLAEAIRLLDAEGFEEGILRSTEMHLELVLAAMTEQIQQQTKEAVPEDLLEQVRQAVREHSDSMLRAKMGEIKQQAAAIYAQEFTREELIRLRQISSDPLMVKARERSKVIGPKMMALGVRTARASEPELQAKVNRLVSEYIARQTPGDDQS